MTARKGESSPIFLVTIFEEASLVAGESANWFRRTNSAWSSPFKEPTRVDITVKSTQKATEETKLNTATAFATS